VDDAFGSCGVPGCEFLDSWARDGGLGRSCAEGLRWVEVVYERRSTALDIREGFPTLMSVFTSFLALDVNNLNCISLSMSKIW